MTDIPLPAQGTTDSVAQMAWYSEQEATSDAFGDGVSVAELSATGTKDATTFLRGDNTWAAPDLGTKANRLLTINAQAGAYTLALTDADDVAVHMTSASAVTLTYPPNSSVAIPIGASGVWFAAGAGQITHTAGAGVTLQAQGGALKSAGQFSEGTWRKVATNTFVVSGLLTT